MNIFKNLIIVGALGLLTTACATMPMSAGSQRSQFGESCDENLTTTMEVVLLSGMTTNVPELFCRDANNATTSMKGTPFLRDPKWYVSSLTEIFGRNYIESIRNSNDPARVGQKALVVRYSTARGSRNSQTAGAFLLGALVGLAVNNNGNDYYCSKRDRRRGHCRDARDRKIDRYFECRNRNSERYCNRNRSRR